MDALNEAALKKHVVYTAELSYNDLG